MTKQTETTVSIDSMVELMQRLERLRTVAREADCYDTTKDDLVYRALMRAVRSCLDHGDFVPRKHDG